MVDAAGYRHWTDAELELLADRSLAAADVAAATGRTEMAVRAARSRRGICRTRWTAEEIGRLRDYAASPKQIAAETGRSLSAVYAKRSEMGLPTPAAMRGGRPRGGRRDGQPSGIGENRASSLTPPGMRQCLMPPPCFTLSAGACSSA